MAKYTKKQLENLSINQLKQLQSELLGQRNISKPSKHNHQTGGYLKSFNKNNNTIPSEYYPNTERDKDTNKSLFRISYNKDISELKSVGGRLHDATKFLEDESIKHNFEIVKTYNNKHIRAWDNKVLVSIGEGVDDRSRNKFIENINRDPNILRVEGNTLDAELDSARRPPRTNTVGRTRGQCIGADWCGGPQETENYMSPMCGNEPNLDPGGGNCQDPSCACPSTRRYCSNFTSQVTCECCGDLCQNGPVGGCQWADCPYPECDSDNDCQNYCQFGDSFIGSCNGCECVYEEYECDYGCNDGSGLCFAAPGFLGPADQSGPTSGDIGGPNEPGSMGCKDPEACNYCEDCVYNCPPNNEYCYCTYIGIDYINECGCLRDDDSDGICDEWDIGYDGVVDECIGSYDECGVCNGPGILDGECDCEGNFLGCTGFCDSSILDECGVCDGSGPSFVCWDGSMVCDESECTGTEDPYFWWNLTEYWPSVGTDSMGNDIMVANELACKTESTVEDMVNRLVGGNVCWANAYHKYGDGYYGDEIIIGHVEGSYPEDLEYFWNLHSDMDNDKWDYWLTMEATYGWNPIHALQIAHIMVGKTHNNSGGSGLCPTCRYKYYPIGNDISAIFDAMIDDGVRLSNHSWNANIESQDIEEIIREAFEIHNHLTITSAGNYGCDMEQQDTNDCLWSNIHTCGDIQFDGQCSFRPGSVARKLYSRTALNVFDSGGLMNYDNQYNGEGTISYDTGTEWYVDDFKNGVTAPDTGHYASFGDYQLETEYYFYAPIDEDGNPCYSNDNTSFGFPDSGPGAPRYTMIMGTSFSAPTVTGIAAYILSHNPDLTAADLKSIILNTANLPSYQSGDGEEYYPKDACCNIPDGIHWSSTPCPADFNWRWDANYDNNGRRNRPPNINTELALDYLYENYDFHGTLDCVQEGEICYPTSDPPAEDEFDYCCPGTTCSGTSVPNLGLLFKCEVLGP